MKVVNRMIEKITEAERNGLITWIDNFAYGNRKTYSRDDIAPIEKLFAPWKEAKSEYLYKMFGEKLIISEEISYEKDKYELHSDFNCVYNTINGVSNFLCSYRDDVHKHFRWSNFSHILERLSYTDSLVDNKYTEETIEVPNPKNPNSPIKLQNGSKITKFLRKYAEAYDIANYDIFINEYSKVMNSKKMTGNLCLSIHPLDYLTMSDNNCNWASCMSWKDSGCYRQGTVEMMNSPCVVVAYLESNKNKLRINDDFEWNSKKWRCLYIVTEEIITEILAYPYKQDVLTTAVLNRLKTLAETNLGWKYEDKLCERQWANFITATNKKVNFTFDTEYMYNDCENNGDKGWAFVAADIEDGEGVRINYSGVDECMVCGAINSIEHESLVVCETHNGSIRCYECDSYLDEEDAYWVGDEAFCEECYNELPECDICEEHMLYSEERHIDIILPNGNIEPYRVCPHHFEMFTGKIANLTMVIDEDKIRHIFNDRIQIDITNLTKRGLEYLNLELEF